eukprot:CAMPEP_0118648692 /NCGR_PEP_ID=MMETSP0785-20121206/9296_1 /TAXON_ID=91992 /ORGANISM="Bolidomonas pacifica, Strain CCMP 1866" /LENGTH=131 /DNA_ID=CAMNT_0006540911 /DNA_START=367 /DNA_END=758 /DNA_ORIENTATION=+
MERVGRLLVEFTPRVNRVFHWDKQQTFAMTVEECALIQHQLPAGHPVELSRRNEDMDTQYMSSNNNSTNPTNLDKVLFVEPTEGASVTFSLDYIDTDTGLGGGENVLSVKMMAGEFGVFQNLITYITPHLL